MSGEEQSGLADADSAGNGACQPKGPSIVIDYPSELMECHRVIGSCGCPDDCRIEATGHVENNFGFPLERVWGLITDAGDTPSNAEIKAGTEGTVRGGYMWDFSDMENNTIPGAVRGGEKRLWVLGQFQDVSGYPRSSVRFKGCDFRLRIT